MVSLAGLFGIRQVVVRGITLALTLDSSTELLDAILAVPPSHCIPTCKVSDGRSAA